MGQYIAERKLLYSFKGRAEKNEVVVLIGAPYQVERDMVNFSIGDGLVGCRIEIEGLPTKGHDVYGVDSVQVLHIACNIESLLERLQKKYDLYWLTGEPYFECDDEG